MDNPQSPVGTVRDVLRRQLGIEATNLTVMMLIDAVRETTPPPREVTIGMLTKILQSLDPAQAVEAWADRSSREIVKLLSNRPEVRQVAELVDNEAIWCTLEGTIAGMLLRVCRGQDLDVVASGHELPPPPAVEPGRDQPPVQPEPAERDDGPGGA